MFTHLPDTREIRKLAQGLIFSSIFWLAELWDSLCEDSLSIWFQGNRMLIFLALGVMKTQHSCAIVEQQWRSLMVVSRETFIHFLIFLQWHSVQLSKRFYNFLALTSKVGALNKNQPETTQEKSFIHCSRTMHCQLLSLVQAPYMPFVGVRNVVRWGLCLVVSL